LTSLAKNIKIYRSIAVKFELNILILKIIKLFLPFNC